MKIRRYTCRDMQEALLKVKMDLGSEAVIMNSKKVKPKGLMGLFAKPMIEVVAAIDDDYVRTPKNVYQQRPPVPETVSAPVPSEPVYKKPEPKQPEPDKAGVNEENRKINELETKVKSMESMLDQIYKAVQTKDGPENENDTKSRTQEQSVAPPEPSPVNEGHLQTLRDTLQEHDVEPRLVEKIMDKIKERGGQALKLEDVMSLAARVITILLGEPEPMRLKGDKKPYIVLFLGPTGVGKTTTLAKIAADFTLNQQKKVGLITADTYRIAAVEQLKTYAEILNLQVTVVYSPNEIKEAVQRLADNDLILIDTAGRSHRNKTHFDELKMLVNTVNADETYLVMSCNTSRVAIREILEYYAFIKDYKLLFTKLDESPVSGVILNARYITGKPLSYTTAGQSVPDDLDIADVKQLVSSILTKGSM